MKTAILFLVVLSACGGSSSSDVDGSVTLDAVVPVDSSSGVDGSVGIDAGPVDYPDAGLPVSHCYDGAHVVNNATACHCVHLCDANQTWASYYVCSQAPADNMSGTGNAAGHCNEGRCLDIPTGGPCP